MIILLFCYTSIFAQQTQHQLNEQLLKNQKQVAAATVLLNNKTAFVPIKNLQQNIASVNLGVNNAVIFDSILNSYGAVAGFAAGHSLKDLNELSIDLKFFQTVIIELSGEALSDKIVFSFLMDIQKTKHLVLVIYGTPAALIFANEINQPIIITSTDSPASANYVAQLIFGGVAATEKLSKRISKKFHKGAGFLTKTTRLKYTLPEDAGLDITDIQNPVDSLVADAIHNNAIPGAVVMVLKDGKVIFNKAYGKHTYEGTDSTRIADIFDMASVTKVSASTMAIMRLYEQKKIELDSTFGYYFAPARNTNKSNIKIRDLLLHQSGIASGVELPLAPSDINEDFSAAYPLKAGDKVFISKNYFKEVILPRMLNVAVDTPKYVYSDLSMTYMKEVIENEAGIKLDEYVANQFYIPLGMQSAGYNPLARFNIGRLVPTQRNADFRKGLIDGYVHDPMAAKYGGVSGNAGLFADANDLAILYQMILNGGTYGGAKYFDAKTIQLFTSAQSAISRRGLGFDRMDTTRSLGYPSTLGSFNTYGHTGFTGTSFWVDPAYGLVYIFLSNRVYPSASGTLYKLNTQANIFDVFYAAILKSKKK